LYMQKQAWFQGLKIDDVDGFSKFSGII